MLVGRKRRVTLKFLGSYLCMSKNRELTLSLTRMVDCWWWCFARARETKHIRVHAVRASKTIDSLSKSSSSLAASSFNQ